MGDRMTIGELARRGGVADSTVRFYERKGLLLPSGRTRANYRVYDPEAVSRLQFIRSAQASGLSLQDIQTLLEFRDGLLAPCAEVKAVIELRPGQVKKQVRDLRTIQRTLESYRKACDAAGDEDQCPVLDEFGRGRTRS